MGKKELGGGGSSRFLAEKPFPLFLVTLPLGVFDKLFTYRASQC